MFNSWRVKVNPGERPGAAGRICLRGRHRGWPDSRLASALAPLAGRVARSFWLHSIGLSLTWGLAAAVGVLAVSYFSAAAAPLVYAVLAGAAVAGLVAGWRFWLRPDALAVARLADVLGTEGRAITAFRLLEKAARGPWEEAALTECLAACAGAGRRVKHPVSPSRTSWLGAGVLGLAFGVLAFLPNPLSSLWLDNRQEHQALAAAASRVEAVVEQAERLQAQGEDVLKPGEKEKLRSLLDTLRQPGRNRDQAAAGITEARVLLEEASARTEPRAGDDWRRLQAAWQESTAGQWQGLAQALAGGQADSIKESLRELTARGGAAERAEAALELFQRAEGVADPGLWRELREAARELSSSGGEAEGGGMTGSGQAAAGLDGLANRLAALAQHSAAAASLAMGAATLGAVGQALAGGSDARAVASSYPGPGIPGAGFGPGAPAVGGPSGGTTAAGSGGNTGTGGTVGDGGPGGASGGIGAGSGTHGGDGSGGDTPGNSGDGGPDGSGSGRGGGSGLGDGGPGSGGQGAGRSGGGLQLVYAPSFLEGGTQQSQVSGEVREGEAGADITLASSPTALGAVRPYTEVLPRYLSEARESLMQAPLPETLAGLVQRYFTSLEPVAGR